MNSGHVIVKMHAFIFQITNRMSLYTVPKQSLFFDAH